MKSETYEKVSQAFEFLFDEYAIRKSITFDEFNRRKKLLWCSFGITEAEYDDELDRRLGFLSKEE